MNTYKKITKIIWFIILITLSSILWFISADKTKVVCLSDLPYEEEYYMEYLAPYIIIGINKMFAGILLIAGLVFIMYACLLEEANKKDKNQGKNIDFAINVMYFLTSIALFGYTLTCYLLLKSVSWLSLTCGIVAFVGVSISIINIIVRRIEKSQSTGKIPVVSLVIVVFALIIGSVSSGVCYAPKINETTKKQEELYRNINISKIYVCFTEKGDDLNTYRPYVRVQFVNLLSNSGRQYTVEELTECYYNFKNNEGSWEALWQFCEDSIYIELDIEIDENLDYDDSEDYPFMDIIFFRYDILRSYGYIDYDGENYIYEGYRYEDVIHFGGCVERLLNSQGLTLVKLKDGSNAPAAMDAAEKYEEAQFSDVEAACAKIAEEYR